MKTKVTGNPDKNELMGYQKQIWEDNAEHNVDAEWIKEQDEVNIDINQMPWIGITKEQVEEALTKPLNRKALDQMVLKIFG